MQSENALRSTFVVSLAVGLAISLLPLIEGAYLLTTDWRIFEGDRINHGLVIRGTGIFGIAVTGLFFFCRQWSINWLIVPLFFLSLGTTAFCSLLWLELLWKNGWDLGALLILAPAGIVALLAIGLGTWSKVPWPKRAKVA